MIWLAFALAAVPTVPTNPLAVYGAGDGSGGSVTITPTTPVSGPAYARIAGDIDVLDTEVDLVDASGFGIGDLVMFWQVTGPPEPDAGDEYADLEDAGSYHLARVSGVTGNRLVLDGPVARPFLSDHTQVVQVLQFQDLTIEQDAVVPVPPWNGETGGILFVTVAGTLDSQGLIDGYGAGFRGGDHHDGSFDFGCEGLENDRAGRAGEGLHGTSERGRGNRGTGGGGGNCSDGGQGGNGWNNCTTHPAGGLGGLSLAAEITGSRVFMGGGGSDFHSMR